MPLFLEFNDFTQPLLFACDPHYYRASCECLKCLGVRVAFGRAFGVDYCTDPWGRKLQALDMLLRVTSTIASMPPPTCRVDAEASTLGPPELDDIVNVLVDLPLPYPWLCRIPPAHVREAIGAVARGLGLRHPNQWPSQWNVREVGPVLLLLFAQWLAEGIWDPWYSAPEDRIRGVRFYVADGEGNRILWGTAHQKCEGAFYSLETETFAMERWVIPQDLPPVTPRRAVWSPPSVPH